MPRRKPKHLFQPGQSGNPAGKTPGTPNKIVLSEKVREAFSQLLEGSAPQLQDWLNRTAQKHPDKALDLWLRISERFVPSLSRTEITGADGTQFTPITINIPTLIAQQTTGESTPIPLSPHPEEEAKALPDSPAALPEPEESSEGAPTDLPKTEEPPQFIFAPQIPVKPPQGYKKEF